MKKTTILPSAICFAVSGSLLAGTVVLPTNDEGDTFEPNEEPVALSSNPMTVQYVYPAAFLAGIPHGSSITGIAFRKDEDIRWDAWPSLPVGRAGSSEHFDVQMSKSVNAPGHLSNTFAHNIGPDAVTVRTGPLSLAHQGEVTVFSPEILFTTPYVYTGGDLLITIRHTGFTDWEYNPPIDASSGTPSAPLQGICVESYTGTVADPAWSPYLQHAPVIRLTLAAAVPFAITEFLPLDANQFRIRWNSVAGTTYRIETSTLLSPADWQFTGSPVSATGASSEMIVTKPDASPARFWRVITP